MRQQLFLLAIFLPALLFGQSTGSVKTLSDSALSAQADSISAIDNSMGVYKLKLQILCLDKNPMRFDTVLVNDQICVTDSLGYLQTEVKWDNNCYGRFKKHKRKCLDISNQKYLICQIQTRSRIGDELYTSTIFVKNPYRRLGIKGKRQKKAIKVYNNCFFVHW